MVHDPLAGSQWSDPRTVEGFVRSPPNASLLEFAAGEFRSGGRLLDLGCGAGRNALPLAHMGWRVIASDLSTPMLNAAARRVKSQALSGRIRLVHAPMEPLPFATDSFDFVIAHGIWNLARSGSEFRKAVNEAARVARPDAPVFVFTFSRHTLADDATPVPGETFVFTQFSGHPHCFLTNAELITELGNVGFTVDPAYPMRELNRTSDGLRTSPGPVIYEGVFRLRR